MIKNKFLCWPGKILIVILILAVEKEVIIAQSSQNFSLKNSTTSIAGQTSSLSNNHKLADALGQPSPVGKANRNNFSVVSGFIATIHIIRTAVENSQLTVPNKYYLNQNYPNPFNPSTTIEFGLAKPGNVKIKIWNILGQLVSQPVNKNFEAGTYKIIFEASNLKSGLYFYQIQTGDFTHIKKMVLTK